jgi:multiple sugar transport system ATP-binding protein
MFNSIFGHLLTMARITIQNLRKEYGTETAVEGINLTVNDGEFLSLVGPSGCGKTTTLRCIAGLETPTSGDISIGDTTVTNKPPQRRELAMVFQDIALYPHMTVEENISYPLRLRGVSKSEQKERIRDATEMLQINNLLEKNVGDLSGGQSQRVALARAIVRKPTAFLFDEPMSDLDANLKIEMRKELGKIQNRLNDTMVYVTHDQEEAMTLSDRIAIMNDGQLEQTGTPTEVFEKPANTFVANFIGSPNMNFLDSTVISLADDVLTLAVEGAGQFQFEYEGDDVTPQEIPEKVILAFRPSRVTVNESDTDGITGTIELNESIGDEIIQYLSGPQGEIRAVTPVSDVYEEGETVSIQVPMSAVHLFDADSKERLLRGKQVSKRIRTPTQPSL